MPKDVEEHRQHVESACGWTRFCVACDGIQVPSTVQYRLWHRDSPYDTYENSRCCQRIHVPCYIGQQRVLFKECMGLPGDKKVHVAKLKQDGAVVRRVASAVDNPIYPDAPEKEVEQTIKLYEYLNY